MKTKTKTETIKDDRLEQLSENVNRGIPIDFHEVFEVMDYQGRIKKAKPPTMLERFLKLFK